MMSKYLSRYRLVGECCHAQWQLQFRSTEDYNWTIINHDGARDFHNKKYKKYKKKYMNLSVLTYDAPMM